MRKINLLHAHGSPTDHLYQRHGCRCTACRAAKSIFNAAYRAAHRDERRAHDAAYNVAHRDERRAYNAVYYVAHRDEIFVAVTARRAAHPEILTRMAVWQAAHREEENMRKAAIRVAHPEVYAAHCRNRRARKRNAPGTHTAADVLAQYQRQRGRCFWCGAKVPWRKKHTDHVVPIVLRGSNGPENLVIACPACNCSKSAKHPMDFAGVML